MPNLRELKPTPHPTNFIFKKYGISRSSIAQALGLSYPYVSSLLTGIRQATPEVDSKLVELAGTLECEANEAQGPNKRPGATEGGSGQ
jgi:hypothetical protein